MSKWQGAHVGVDSKTIGLRVTEEEEERLERLRGDLRLTSKGQVLRAALDVLEVLNTPTEFVLGGPERVRKVWTEHPEFVEAVLRKLGGLVAEPDADAGLSSAAPAGGQALEEQAA
jgi:hypothetical protein